MVSHDFDIGILDDVAHRPWPMPDSPWLMTQTWHDLLFAHWRVNASALHARVPDAFELDLFDGDAWIGVVPFRMTNVAPRGVPALPWVAEFPELNVRTYVRVGDRPGVYFFSLDAGNALAVQTARTILNLPYHFADMEVSITGHDILYRSRRNADPPAELEALYRPANAVFEAQQGSLEYFLTERYCLYNLHRSGSPYRLEIHHRPWPLQSAAARFSRNTLMQANGLAPPHGQPLLHFAKRQDVVAWAPSALK